jgi:CRISPR-associated protein (TIGR02710 family)
MDPDDLSTAYTAIVNTIRRIRREDPEAKLWCDHTGGTKTMSAALAMAAVDEGDIRIMLVAGNRPDLVKVEDGTQYLTPARMESILVNRLSREVDQLWSHYEFAAAARILRAFLSATGQTYIAGWLSVCLGFDAWDRFDHASAFRHLKALRASSFAPCLAFLGPLAHARGEAWESPVGYRFVSDLLANAERRAAQGRYDDAVARHYRAIELFIQTWLWNVNAIDTGGIREDQVPDNVEWKGQVEEWPLRPGLIRAWDLAAALDARINDVWKERKSAVRHATERRNFSILAHGCRPIDVSGYDVDRTTGLGYLTREALNLVSPRPPEVPPFVVSVSACD